MASFSRNLNVIVRCTQMQRTHCLKELGISGPQSSYILRLNAHPGLTQDELAQALYFNKSTVTRTVSRLEQAGFIERRPSDTDRRCNCLYLTQKGTNAVPAIKKVHHAWADYLLEEFSEAEQQQLLEMLEKLSLRAQAYACREEVWNT